MRTIILGLALLVTSVAGSSPMQLPAADGVYVSIKPVLGRAMVGSALVDVAFVATDRPMKQFVGATEVMETFGIDTPNVGFVAESHGGEIVVIVSAWENGRIEQRHAAQGKHVICHYSRYNTGYCAPFNDR